MKCLLCRTVLDRSAAMIDGRERIPLCRSCIQVSLDILSDDKSGEGDLIACSVCKAERRGSQCAGFVDDGADVVEEDCDTLVLRQAPILVCVACLVEALSRAA